MNLLQTNYNGKMPLELDDIRWEQDAVRDAFYGLISAFGIDPIDSFKLSGCDVTISGSTYNCTEGYICLNGEVLKVDAHSISFNPVTQQGAFKLDVSYDPAGLEVFEDSSSHETYEVRKGKLEAITIVVPNTTRMLYNAQTIYEVVVTKIKALDGAWMNIGSGGQPAFEAGWSNAGGAYEVVSYKKDAFGNVFLKGVATSVTPIGTIFSLPAGYRPAFVRYYACLLGAATVNIAVETDGSVHVVGISNIETEIDLGSITFRV